MNIAQEARSIMSDCLYADDEVQGDQMPETAVLVGGIVQAFAMHKERLAKNAPRIAALIEELSPEFFEEGGGASFLKLPFDKRGNHWGEHSNAEVLMVLAIGIRQAAFCFPRELWRILPGGMPYVRFFHEAFPEKSEAA